MRDEDQSQRQLSSYVNYRHQEWHLERRSPVGELPDSEDQQWAQLQTRLRGKKVSLSLEPHLHLNQKSGGQVEELRMEFRVCVDQGKSEAQEGHHHCEELWWDSSGLLLQIPFWQQGAGGVMGGPRRAQLRVGLLKSHSWKKHIPNKTQSKHPPARGSQRHRTHLQPHIPGKQ